jgi:hypothetical protein
MSTEQRSRPSVLSQLVELLEQGRDLAANALAGVSLESLQRETRGLLLDCGRRLGLSGLDRLRKTALAERLLEALRTLTPDESDATDQGARRPPPPGAPAPVPAVDLPADAAHKFDLGPQPPRPLPAHIPWGYGEDRVTAMVVDPETLFVYWEATDDGIATARRGLGAGAADPWLSLRVYDVTGRLFDGTNAHSYFDHRVERTDRQYFFRLGRPTSTAIVELGMKSREGYFVRIARSGRADFPRREPSGSTHVEWMTVRVATGEVAGIAAGAPGPDPAAPPPDEPDPPVSGDAPGPDAPAREWVERMKGEWSGEEGVWHGPFERTAWEAGPFEVPVTPPDVVEERWEGGVATWRENGRVHVVYGPWQVVIRGIGGWSDTRVIAVWEVERTWAIDGDQDVVVGPGRPRSAALGAPERLGASERLGAGEARLGGASERWRLGASELRFAGASERARRGASELRLGGASERRLGGASEWQAGGASEAVPFGGSDRARATGR